jgi:Na+-transporting NADH:ubiquinone oxidoreductase subunit NqrC
MFNLILLGLFVSMLGSLILYKYKGKLTPEEMEQRELEKYKYILNKIKITQESSLQEKQRLLSGQPLWVENVY